MNTPGIDESTTYGLLKMLEENPVLSQRELSDRLGVSLGKVNYCLKALVNKGCLKISNFKNSRNKLAYAYLLTPRGVEEKTHMTVTFLRYKMQEYDRLRTEIEALKTELSESISNNDQSQSPPLTESNLNILVGKGEKVARKRNTGEESKL